MVCIINLNVSISRWKKRLRFKMKNKSLYLLGFEYKGVFIIFNVPMLQKIIWPDLV